MSFEYADFVKKIYPFGKRRFYTGFDGIDPVKPSCENIDRFILLPSGLTSSMIEMYFGFEHHLMTKDTLSKYRNYRPIHDYIVECYLIEGTLERTEESFARNLPKIIFEEELPKLVGNIMDLIDRDFDFPKKFFTYIRGLAEDGCYYRFLAEAFVYSITHHVKDYSDGCNDSRLSPIVSAAVEECRHGKISSYVIGTIDIMNSDLFYVDSNNNAIPKEKSRFNEDDAYALAIALVKHQKELDKEYQLKVHRIVTYSISKRLLELYQDNSSANKLLNEYGFPYRVFTFDKNDKIMNEFSVGGQRMRLEYEKEDGLPTLRFTGLDSDDSKN